ncbi:acyloxyacyl hydrolase [Pseudoalteromonas sp. BZB3]|uniref:acyloxyacyl hydrolase n=1 Tax=Pseudoalteromonas sp. BZB3 TaxID=3136670 RepID=UPI0032C4A78D
MNLLRLLALAFLLTFTSTAFADNKHGYAIHYIHGEGDVDGIKLAYQYHPENLLPDAWKNFDLHFESSVNFWNYSATGRGSKSNHDTNFVLALTPVFKYPLKTWYEKPLYLELGIGLAVLDDTHFAGKNVSTHYQFEDRLGLVYDLGDAKVAVRYIHYSNAGFKSPNPGLDFISLSYSSFFSS